MEEWKIKKTAEVKLKSPNIPWEEAERIADKVRALEQEYEYFRLVNSS